MLRRATSHPQDPIYMWTANIMARLGFAITANYKLSLFGFQRKPSYQQRNLIMPGGIPPPMTGGIPPGPPAPGPGELPPFDAKTSSTLRIIVTASTADLITCVFTLSGSTTSIFSMSAAFPVLVLTPNQMF